MKSTWILLLVPLLGLLFACAPLSEAGNRLVGSVGIPPLFGTPAPDALELSVPYGRGAREVCLKKGERTFAALPAIAAIRQAALERSTEVPADDAPAVIVRLYPSESNDAGLPVGNHVLVGFQAKSFKPFLVAGEPLKRDDKLFARPILAEASGEVDITLGVEAPIELWLSGFGEGCGLLEIRRSR